MRLTPSEEKIIELIKFDQHVSIQAAAYTVYVELTPNNKKPISQREFHQIFKDNWLAFHSLEMENYEYDV